jgi:hypothetical protein
MDDSQFRASDADRDHTVAALQQAVSAGRLSLEEFSQRIDLALQGRTTGALSALTRDLPSPAPKPTSKSYLMPALVVLVVLLLVGTLLGVVAGPAVAGTMSQMMTVGSGMCQ